MMLKYEMKKIFTKRINQVLLAAALLIGIILSCFAVGSVFYTDENGDSPKGITAWRLLAEDKNQWEGELTPEKISEVLKIDRALAAQYPDEVPDEVYGSVVQSYWDIKDFVINVLTPDSMWDESVIYQLTDEQTGEIYEIYRENMSKMAEEYGTTPEKKEFLNRIYEKVETPFVYEAKDSWDTMPVYVETYAIILAVISGFLAAGIFSGEFRPGAEDIFLASKYGRSRAVKNKIIAGVLMTTAVYWIGMGILSLISFGIMGTSGFSTPVQIWESYSIYIMTHGEYYLLMLVCGYIASLFCTSLTMLVTVKMHTAGVAVCIPFFLLCMMPFVGRALSSFTSFFNLMPNVLINIVECVKTPILYQVGNVVFRQVPLAMVIYSAAAAALLPFIYRSCRRRGLRNWQQIGNRGI